MSGRPKFDSIIIRTSDLLEAVEQAAAGDAESIALLRCLDKKAVAEVVRKAKAGGGE